MEIDFVGERDKFIFIYLDDMIVFSKKDEYHIKNIRQIFVKCRKFGLSLNPQNSYFYMEEENILSHIVSKQGVNIDPEMVEAIKQNAHPRKKKDVQSFLGKIDFLRRFVPNLSQMVSHITNMLKKEHEVKWIVEAT
jgi:hypothetical protein